MMNLFSFFCAKKKEVGGGGVEKPVKSIISSQPLFSAIWISSFVSDFIIDRKRAISGQCSPVTCVCLCAQWIAKSIDNWIKFEVCLDELECMLSIIHTEKKERKTEHVNKYADYWQATPHNERMHILVI